MRINKKLLDCLSDESIIAQGIIGALTKKPVPNNYPKPPKLTESRGGGAIVMINGRQDLILTDEHGNAFEFSHKHETKDLSTWIDPDTFEFVRWARSMDF